MTLRRPFLFSANQLEEGLKSRPHFTVSLTQAMNLASADELVKSDSDCADFSGPSPVYCVAIAKAVMNQYCHALFVQ